MNHINEKALGKTIEMFSKEPEKAVKEFSVEGEWILEEGAPQFRSRIPFERGEATLSMDNPTPMGGSGSAPNPLQYCLFGLASCFASTYMMVATQKGVAIDRLSVRVENRVDMTRPLGLSDNPLTEGVRILLRVTSEAEETVLREIEELSRKSCPAVYCLTQPIPFTVEVAAGRS